MSSEILLHYPSGWFRSWKESVPQCNRWRRSLSFDHSAGRCEALSGGCSHRLQWTGSALKNSWSWLTTLLIRIFGSLHTGCWIIPGIRSSPFAIHTEEWTPTCTGWRHLLQPMTWRVIRNIGNVRSLFQRTSLMDLQRRIRGWCRSTLIRSGRSTTSSVGIYSVRSFISNCS